MTTPLRVLFVTSELNPLAKVGGLGDVAGALPRALRELGVDVRVALPKYEVIDIAKYPAKLVVKQIPLSRCGITENIAVWKTVTPQNLGHGGWQRESGHTERSREALAEHGARCDRVPGLRTRERNIEVPVYLIDNPDYIGSGGIYFEKTAFVGSFKEIERFLFFSLATLECFAALDWWPDIIHCQDWHTGMIPTLLAEKAKRDERYRSIKTLYTVHNLANQGRWNARDVTNFLCLDLPARDDGDLNLMERGLRNATAINTVSKTYAKEIQTPEFGEGLARLLKSEGDHVYGIVNGVDQEFFNPETDDFIKQTYTQETVNDAKSENKRDLQRTLGLPESDAPLFGLVSRFTSQKGIELVAEILPDLVRAGAQCVFLGVGEEHLEQKLTDAAKRHPQNIVTALRFDAKLANQIYAGADLFLMPSKFEPCGLGQMIAMRYGTIPIVRKTGGLVDTVTPYAGGKTDDQGWGFAFQEFSTEALKAAALEALEVYQDKPTWQHLIQNAMAYDSSWIHAAKEYVALYHKIV
ncbi:MAG: glycogen synthase [Candidatus Kerfeldbacteria bacterium]|nr:glycogen synthase [Candidatus Kerfeldbacteria bacterium]